MFRMGWQRGQNLGRDGKSEKMVQRRSGHSDFSEAQHPEMWWTFAGTLSARGTEIFQRVKRNHEGVPKEVVFIPGPVFVSTVGPVQWSELSKALVEMTEYGFSENPVVHDINYFTGESLEQEFSWGNIHRRLCDINSLPEDLQRGFNAARNEAFGKKTMEALLAYQTHYWKWNTYWVREYQTLVGTLWKTLEKAMNAAGLSLDFCLFFCSEVMNALKEYDCGSMTFVPIFTGESFQARVRYRAQGLRPEQRYRGKATHSQVRNISLLRPFLAAEGIAPASGSRIIVVPASGSEHGGKT